MSVSRWPLFRRVLRRQRLMDVMMTASGVDVLAVMRVDAGRAFLEASSKCCDCHNERKCRDWIQSGEPGRDAPEFCPNSELFRTCKRRE
jgi:hypothetical protein